jgi:ADP-heptose:LPS heptosyltransferase
MMRVIVLIPGGIGDQLLCFPTLDDLKQQYPEAQIDVVVEPRAQGVYRICPSVQGVLPFDFQNRNALADWVNLLGLLREREYDLGIVTGQRWITSALLWLTGVPTRIGYSGNAIGDVFLTNSVPLKLEQYRAHHYHDLLQGLGMTTPCPDLQIRVPQKDIAWAEAEQKRLGLLEAAAGNYVVIGDSCRFEGGPGGAAAYPVAAWKAVIEDFQQRQPELPILLLQGPGPLEELEALVQAYPALKVSAPEDLGKVAALLAGASLVLCTEGVLLHLAVAVQTYTIALFGPGEPEKLLPASDRFLALGASSGQLADISPQQVLAKVWGT